MPFKYSHWNMTEKKKKHIRALMIEPWSSSLTTRHGSDQPISDIQEAAGKFWNVVSIH